MTRSSPRRSKRFHTAALKHLQAHDWPGDVCELESPCRCLAAPARPGPGEAITQRELGNAPRGGPVADAGDAIRPLTKALLEAMARVDTTLHAILRECFGQNLLETALDRSEGHRQLAAKRLGLGRNATKGMWGRERKPR